MILKEKLSYLIPEWRERVSLLLNESRDCNVGEVTIGQVYGGMRGIKGLVSDISSVDPNEGIRLRGFTIPELLEVLPKDKSTEMPMVGGLYYLLLIGEIPSLDEALEVEDEWKSRWDIPAHLSDVLQAMPEDASPMTLFSQAILSLQGESVFTKKYREGLHKSEYWEPMLEDSLNLTAKLPAIAALIYSLKHRDGQTEQHDPNLDWSANFAHMMQVADNDY